MEELENIFHKKSRVTNDLVTLTPQFRHTDKDN